MPLYDAVVGVGLGRRHDARREAQIALGGERLERELDLGAGAVSERLGAASNDAQSRPARNLAKRVGVVDRVDEHERVARERGGVERQRALGVAQRLPIIA